MLILFDIDSTLIDSAGSGASAIGAAGRELFGPGFDARRVAYAGRLDPLILGDLLRIHGHDDSPEQVGRFRAVYRRHLAGALDSAGPRPLPGIPQLLDALEAAGRDRVTLGLLTGNFEETGSMKLRACGIDPGRFGVRVWGDDSPEVPPCRDHLPFVAFDRYREHHGRACDPASVTVVGDTPFDMRCARAGACRGLGVATGVYSVQDLHAAGADHVFEDLSATEEVISWLISDTPARNSVRR